jgi:hypothetical protein
VAHQNHLQAALWTFVDDGQEWIMGTPDPEWRRENEVIIARTLLRKECFVKAEADTNHDFEAILDASPKGHLAREILEHFNFCLLGEALRHYCNGRCCSSLQECKLKSYSLMLRADVLCANDCSIASIDNWETLGEGLADICFGTFLFRALPCSVGRALPNWKSCQPKRINLDNPHSVKIAKKAYRTKMVFGSPSRILDLMLTNFYGAHLEHLIVHLDYLDCRGNGLLEVVLEDTCPIRRALVAVSTLMQSSPVHGELSVVYRYFEGCDEITPRVIHARSSAMAHEFGSQLFWRLLPLKNLPYTLVGLVHPAVGVSG